MLNKVLCAVVLCCTLSGGAKAESVLFRFGENVFNIPLKVVHATELYSFADGVGYPAAHSVLWERKTLQFTVGAAAVLGTSTHVPFVSLQTRLSEKFFDISDNGLYFGAWAGHRTGDVDNSKRLINSWGINASTKLW